MTQCRRIDLNFRGRYPYLTTRIYKCSDYDSCLLVNEQVDNFDEIAGDFDHAIKFITVPVRLVNKKPVIFASELPGIPDNEIPSNLAGLPLTHFQLANHIACSHSILRISSLKEDHNRRSIVVELAGRAHRADKAALQVTLDNLRMPYKFEILDGGQAEHVPLPEDEIFNLASAKSKKHLNLPFLERDERLWFENIERIYSSSFHKSDLYFYEEDKTSCFVNFSTFKNINIRNHLLLYDLVYCVLPLEQQMPSFLSDQKITKEELLFLVERGRLKIVNMQPESRLDVNLLREAHEMNPSSVISRRAVSALCAIDLVEMNQSYILNDNGLTDYLFAFLSELAARSGKPFKAFADLLLWPKKALRLSFDCLNNSGPMAIARFGVNAPIIDILALQNKEQSSKLEFDFVINSDHIHVSHALDATYFPFFVDNSKYSDHPFALMMGNMLNFFKTANFQNLNEALVSVDLKERGNPSLQLVNTFDLNEYIPVAEFEASVKSRVIRSGINALFSELRELSDDQRAERIEKYNKEVDRLLSMKGKAMHALDLGQDTVGLVVPFLSTGLKIVRKGTRKAIEKVPILDRVSEYIEDKSTPVDSSKRSISLMTKINRVARLRKRYN